MAHRADISPAVHNRVDVLATALHYGMSPYDAVQVATHAWTANP